MMRSGHRPGVSSHEARLAISFLVGVGPAAALMWVSLRRFDYPMAPKALFDDRRVFLAFAVGMGFGVFASVLTIFLSVMVAAAGGFGGTLSLFVVALFEVSFMLVYLNRPGYRGRFETTFYGTSLGLGAAATLTMASAFSLNPTLAGSPELAGLLALFAVSMALILGSTGSLVGFGTARQQAIRYFARAYLVRLSHLLILFFFFTTQDVPVAAASLVASLAFAAVVYVFVYREILPETLPREIRRELRRWPRETKRPAKESE